MSAAFERLKEIEAIVDASDDEAETNIWEREIQKTWESLKENKKGELKDIHIQQQRLRRKRMRIAKTGNIEKGMVRYLYLILDYSKAMNIRDLKPTRKIALRDLTCSFIKEYFSQNPISQLGIIVGFDKIGGRVTELSGNPSQQIAKLKKITEELIQNTDGGDFSLQNTLDMASSSLRHIPPYGSREILVIQGSLNTCDPGDIFQTIESLQKSSIRASVISLAAQTFVFTKLTQSTYGRRFDVVKNSNDFMDKFLSHTKPYAITQDMKVQRKWIRMAFPKKTTTNYPSLCRCHKEWKDTGYNCPKCMARSCELPTDCQICGRTMVLSSHLARCYHHLLPVQPFEEINNDVSKTWIGECFSCQLELDTSHSLVVTCPKCNKHFCVPCDLYIHESLHNCPGCLAVT